MKKPLRLKKVELNSDKGFNSNMEDFLDEILKNLLIIKPSKIILFGSYATGT